MDKGFWLISFMQYDLGYIDREQRTLHTLTRRPENTDPVYFFRPLC